MTVGRVFLAGAMPTDLATSAIEGTMGLFDLPFAEFCPPQVADLITSAGRDCRASAPEWRLDDACLSRALHRVA
jgi:hypothetical protein